MYVESQILVADPIAAGGTYTGYFNAMNGEILSLSYVKDDFANGVDFTITNETTGETIWTEENVDAAKTVRPMALNQNTAGVDLAISADIPNRRPLFLANERVKVVIANGGVSTGGTFVLKVG